jgi:ATP-dependent protease HslVU (ClpYQ) peptidase subunit
MTVVAWDGKTLAADKASTMAGSARSVRKIHIVPDGIVGFAGDECSAMTLKHWFDNGRIVDNWPECQTGEDAAMAFFVDWNGKTFHYGNSPHATPGEDKTYAMGSGSDYAMAVLYHGMSAVQAVETAIALDCYCGRGVDVLNLTDCIAEQFKVNR